MSYKPLGNYISIVNNKNKGVITQDLRGLSMKKEFRKSTSNIVGTDLSKYKLVYKNQFCCDFMSVIRVHKLPVVLHVEDDPIIVSPAYIVFEINDTNVLNPEYLMMWFRRSEFDRYADFRCDSAIRGGFKWDELCEVELPIPSIEKQNEIVKEYNTIVNRIKLNEQFNKKLEETAQAIYKHWFVDFEFPNEEGEPYKSSGGKMVYNEELDKEIPEGWEVKPLTSIVNLKGGGTPSTKNELYWNGTIPFFTPKDVGKSYYSLKSEKYITQTGLDNCSSKLYSKNTVFVTARGTVGEVAMAGCDMAMNQSCYAIIGDEKINQFFVHQLTLNSIEKLKTEAIGAIFKALVTKDFDDQMSIKPTEIILDQFKSTIESVYENLLIKAIQIEKLISMKDLLLSKMSKVELEKKIMN